MELDCNQILLGIENENQRPQYSLKFYFVTYGRILSGVQSLLEYFVQLQCVPFIDVWFF